MSTSKHDVEEEDTAPSPHAEGGVGDGRHVEPRCLHHVAAGWPILHSRRCWNLTPWRTHQPRVAALLSFLFYLSVTCLAALAECLFALSWISVAQQPPAPRAEVRKALPLDRVDSWAWPPPPPPRPTRSNGRASRLGAVPLQRVLTSPDNARREQRHFPSRDHRCREKAEGECIALYSV